MLVYMAVREDNEDLLGPDDARRTIKGLYFSEHAAVQAIAEESATLVMSIAPRLDKAQFDFGSYAFWWTDTDGIKRSCNLYVQPYTVQND